MKLGMKYSHWVRFFALVPHKCSECGQHFWLEHGRRRKVRVQGWTYKRYNCNHCYEES